MVMSPVQTFVNDEDNNLSLVPPRQTLPQAIISRLFCFSYRRFRRPALPRRGGFCDNLYVWSRRMDRRRWNILHRWRVGLGRLGLAGGDMKKRANDA